VKLHFAYVAQRLLGSTPFNYAAAFASYFDADPTTPPTAGPSATLGAPAARGDGFLIPLFAVAPLMETTPPPPPSTLAVQPLTPVPSSAAPKSSPAAGGPPLPEPLAWLCDPAQRDALDVSLTALFTRAPVVSWRMSLGEAAPLSPPARPAESAASPGDTSQPINDEAARDGWVGGVTSSYERALAELVRKAIWPEV